MSDQALLFELKQLYVAVTRARSNLWIYDQSERGETVRLGLQDQGLVTTLGSTAEGEDSIPLARRSTPQEWSEAGLRFMTAEDFEVSGVNLESSHAHREADLTVHASSKRYRALSRLAISRRSMKLEPIFTYVKHRALRVWQNLRTGKRQHVNEKTLLNSSLCCECSVTLQTNIRTPG